MSDTVQSALEKRKKKQQAEQQARVDTYKKEQESVTAALFCNHSQHIELGFW